MFLEDTVRVLKKKLFQFFQENPDKITHLEFEEELKNVTHSFNTTEAPHGLTPSDANTPYLDPLLRERLYGKQKLQPFEEYYEQQLKWQKKAHTLRPKSAINDAINNFRINENVYIDYDSKKFASKYNPRRNLRIYKIKSVNTLQRPFIYTLKDISPKQRPILGGFYGRELLSADLDDLEVEKILATKKLEDGRTLVKCRYKGYSPSFDRWVEK